LTNDIDVFLNLIMRSNAYSGYPNRPAAFTLIELLLGVAVIGILIAITVVVLGNVRRQSEIATATSNLRQIQLANQTFATDNGGRYAPMQLAGGSWWYQNRDFLYYLGYHTETNPSFSATQPAFEVFPVFRSSASDRPANKSWPDFGYNFTRWDGFPNHTRPIDGHLMSDISEPGRRIAFMDSLFTLVRYNDRNDYNGTEERVGGSFGPAYRHNNHALVVFYDGSVSRLSRAFLTAPENAVMWFPNRPH
jgi:prepilin-type N-terminal cleavage/methylation domain-containing protein